MNCFTEENQEKNGYSKIIYHLPCRDLANMWKEVYKYETAWLIVTLQISEDNILGYGGYTFI